MQNEVEVLRKIESDLLDKLKAVRTVIKMFDPETITQPIIQSENELKVIPRIKVLTLPKLVEAIKSIFGQDLYQKVKDNYSITAYFYCAKIMFPKTGMSEISAVIGSETSTGYYCQKKHDNLLLNYEDYKEQFNALNHKYSIKEVRE